jgi:hypothetical protein
MVFANADLFRDNVLETAANYSLPLRWLVSGAEVIPGKGVKPSFAMAAWSREPRHSPP